MFNEIEGRHLRALRREYGLTQTELALKTGYALSSIWRMEHGWQSTKRISRMIEVIFGARPKIPPQEWKKSWNKKRRTKRQKKVNS